MPAEIIVICENCRSPRETRRSAFCTDYCRCAAVMIRGFRSYRAQERLGQEDIMMAMIQHMRFHIAGITYKALKRTLSRKKREEVLTRDGGMCVHPGCSERATDIDHIGGSSDDPGNLRSLCHNHHLERSTGKIETLIALGDLAEMPEEIKGIISTPIILSDEVSGRYLDLYGQLSPEVRERIESVIPLRACDDHTWWENNWRYVSKTGDSSSWDPRDNTPLPAMPVHQPRIRENYFPEPRVLKPPKPEPDPEEKKRRMLKYEERREHAKTCDKCTESTYRCGGELA